MSLFASWSCWEVMCPIDFIFRWLVFSMGNKGSEMEHDQKFGESLERKLCCHSPLVFLLIIPDRPDLMNW